MALYPGKYADCLDYRTTLPHYARKPHALRSPGKEDRYGRALHHRPVFLADKVGVLLVYARGEGAAGKATFVHMPTLVWQHSQHLQVNTWHTCQALPETLARPTSFAAS